MTTNSTQDRGVFEEVDFSNGYGGSRPFSRNRKNDLYAHEATQWRYEGWQAARATSAPAGDVEPAIDALLSYSQADEDGIMVYASRQAIHEVVGAYRALATLPAPSVVGEDEAVRLYHKTLASTPMDMERDYGEHQTDVARNFYRRLIAAGVIQGGGGK